MSLIDLRMRLSKVTIWVSLTMMIVLVSEIALLFFASYGRQWIFHHYHWLYVHSDDRSLLRLFINSWLIAIAVLLISPIGSGPYRKKSIVASVSNVIGFPTLLIALIALEGMIRS